MTTGTGAPAAAGRELDAEIAERVFGHAVPHRDWPCGYMPDGCALEAASDRAEAAKYAHWFDEAHPVTLARRADGTPVEGAYEPVPFYSTDVAAAWLVVEHFRARGFSFLALDNMQGANGDWWVRLTNRPTRETYEDGLAPTLPLAICRCALAAVGA